MYLIKFSKFIEYKIASSFTLPKVNIHSLSGLQEQGLYLAIDRTYLTCQKVRKERGNYLNYFNALKVTLGIGVSKWIP